MKPAPAQREPSPFEAYAATMRARVEARRCRFCQGLGRIGWRRTRTFDGVPVIAQGLADCRNCGGSGFAP